jgi:hypothetical protein
MSKNLICAFTPGPGTQYSYLKEISIRIQLFLRFKVSRDFVLLSMNLENNWIGMEISLRTGRRY